MRDTESTHETCNISIKESLGLKKMRDFREERERENRKDFLWSLVEKAHLAHAYSTWLGCAITLLLTYLVQSLREVQDKLVCVHFECGKLESK